jgi:Uma2 family endonuclease
MSMPKPQTLHTPEEYLELERRSEERHEYLDGEIYEMAGESPAHGAISTNLIALLHAQLKGTPCQVFSKDTKVRSGPVQERGRSYKGLYSYPDLVVVCGELKFLDEHQDVLTNPTVIIEVLSPATETYDRGDKWLRYQKWLPGLTDYVLVAQLRPAVEHFHRQPAGHWLYTLVSGLDTGLRIDSINCLLPLAEVYDRVAFPPEDELIPEEEEN